MTKLFQHIFILFLFYVYPVNSNAVNLPSADEIDKVWIQPADETSNFYTAETLIAALPYFRKTTFVSLGFGKVWAWQKGIIYLKNGKQLRWRSFANNFILFETDEGPVFYTNIISQSGNYLDGKLIRRIETTDGQKEVIFSLE